MNSVFLRAVLTAGRRVALMLAALAVAAGNVDAKAKRLDDKTLATAVNLAKDRELQFAGEAAMSAEEFQKAWAGFCEDMAQYQGSEIALKKFGNDVRFRKGFAHIIYVGLRAQTKDLELKPSVQELVANHPFLQELVIEGSCYTGGDPFPKKLVELLQASPGMQFLLGETLKGWDPKYSEEFRKLFPDVK
jgi:hypothetical protein